jgi:tRNA(fMet)-specific endonuclease VapC
MIHILDTDVFTLAEYPSSPEFLRLRARIVELVPEDRVATTIVTYEEQTRGWLAFAAKSRTIDHQIQAYARLKRHLLNYLDFDILDFDSEAAERFEHLRSLKLRIATADLKIAAISLAQDALLLSRNLRHFGQVPGLRVQDWTKP